MENEKSSQNPNILNLTSTNTANQNHRKKSIKLPSSIAKSLSNIFSSKNPNQEQENGNPKSPSKDVNVAEKMNALNEDETSSSTGTVMETKRKESFKDKSRRQSRADIRNLTDASSTNSSGYISISNRSVVDLVAQSEDNKTDLPLLIENDYNDYFIDGYAQMDRFTIDKLGESLNYDEINDEEIIETGKEYSYYSKQFKNKEHFNFAGNFDAGLAKSNLYVFSVKYVQDFKFICILRTKDGNLYEEFETKEIFYNENNEKLDIGRVTIGLLMKKFNENMIIREILPVTYPMASDEISLYDKTLLKTTFTFGIIYQKHAQISEKEIFTNSKNSKEFEDFLDFIGQRVTLKNFKKFRGGLDVIDGATGEESVYEYHDNSEIMFHVSTFLPHSDKDQQYVERKRHIGNDRVAIVFQDKDTLFSPKMIRSKLLHVFMIIQPVKINGETKRYKVSVISKKDVPYFGPLIRKPYIFNKDANLKNFLLSKLINAEYASLRAPAFSVYSEKTLESSMQKLYDTLTISTKSFMSTSIFTPTSSETISNNALVSESISQLSPNSSNNTSSINRHSVKSALRKLSTYYLKSDNNPYLAAEASSSSKNKDEESDEVINRSKETSRSTGNSVGNSKYKKKSNGDIGSTEGLSDSSLGSSIYPTKVKSESVDDLMCDNTLRRDTITGILLGSDDSAEAQFNLINSKRLEKAGSSENLKNKESPTVIKIVYEKSRFDGNNNFVNTFNQELDALNSSKTTSNNPTESSDDQNGNSKTEK